MQTRVYQPDLFAQALPRFVACADDYHDLAYLPRSEALRRAHIAPNSPKQVWALAFDIDRSEAGAAWIDANLPVPNWTAQNPKNGHAHLGYALLAPVSRSAYSRGCPQRYLARIQHAMTGALGADRAYAHFLTKTPGHPRWRTIWGRQHPYGLHELANSLPEDMPLPGRIKSSEAVGLGRNVALFDSLKAWAYRARLQYSTIEPWLDACLHRAMALNIFTAPLPNSELRSTARSVARWTWTHFSAEAFAEIQSARGVKSGISRRSKLTELQGDLFS